jgi:hypothetical protein
MGKGIDIDDPKHKYVDNFDLCLRLMDEFKENCFADISAMGLVMRTSYMKPLLKRTDLHDRLVNGSDYPLVMIYVCYFYSFFCLQFFFVCFVIICFLFSVMFVQSILQHPWF